MVVNIADLKPCKLSESIYSSEPPVDLVDSIKRNGLIVPIWITRDNIIISGHRRVNACKKLGMTKITAEIRLYSDSLVIESNRYREKTWSEKLKEAEALEKILGPKAKEKQKEGGMNKVVQNSEQPVNFNKVLMQTARTIGTSHDTLHKVKLIAQKSPELLKEIDAGDKTVNSAYMQLQRENIITKNPKPLPSGVYHVIYADPPWQYEGSLSSRGKPENHYIVMSLDEICKLQVPSANDSVLFLWATAPKLKEALQVMDSWGFEYRTNLVWVKDKIGTGFYFRGKHELLLVGRKGKLPIPRESNRPDSVLFAPRTQHSQKPQQVYNLIERMYPDCKYLELFARTERKNWVSWGNEV